MKMTSVSLSCLALILFDVSLGFHGDLQGDRNNIFLDRSTPLLTIRNPVADITSVGKTALWSSNCIQEDPLEDDNGQPPITWRKNQLFSPSENIGGEQQGQQSERRLARPQKSISFEDKAFQANSSMGTGSNERKATTSTSGGVNLELRDPKERVLVRHATASAAYGVNDFKGKKKKIIKPWSSGRKKNKYKTNNTGGIAREAYGEELKVELKNKPEKKRLVMARTNSSFGSQDAAKALISGGLKGDLLTEEDTAEERRSRKYDSDYDDDSNGEHNLERPLSLFVEELKSENDNGPNLVRLSSSIVREPENDDNIEPNLVRLSSSIVRELKNSSENEPNLVRLESSIIKEPEKDAEEELRLYTRSGTSDEEENKHEEQRLVRAVPASQASSSDEPKLVRPNIVKTQIKEPKLMRPNIVKATVEEPKLVRPNVFRAKASGPKLVRANVQNEKPPDQNLVRAKVIPTDRDVKNVSCSVDPHLATPKSYFVSKDSQGEDFMYGAKASTSSHTAVRFSLKSKSRSSPAAPTSLICDSKRARENSNHSYIKKNLMENLMYGANQAASNPAAVSSEEPTARNKIPKALSTNNDVMDSLMYGVEQATVSPTAVPIELGGGEVVRTTEKISENSMNKSDDSAQVGGSQLPQLMGRELKIKTKTKISAEKAQVSRSVYTDKDRKEKNDMNKGQKMKKYVQPTTSWMNNIRNWDAVQPAMSSSNPSAVHAVLPKSKNETQYKSGDKNSNDNAAEKPKKKSYVQSSTSLMNKSPDWDVVQPATTSSNPTVINIDGPKLDKKEVVHELINEENHDAVIKVPRKKTYFQPSVSMMDNVPDWDDVKSAVTISNPSVLKVDLPKWKKKVKYESYVSKRGTDTEESKKNRFSSVSNSLMGGAIARDVVHPDTTTSFNCDTNKDKETKMEISEVSSDEKTDGNTNELHKKKKYVQPSTSMMKNTPDLDDFQPSTTTSNLTVMSGDAQSISHLKEMEPVIVKKKKYFHPTTSSMDSVVNWDAAQPVITSYNPSHVNIDLQRHKIARDDENKLGAERPQKKYHFPSASFMERAPDWDSTQPTFTTSNPSVVNVDGINKIEKEISFVRPFSSSTGGETHSKTRYTPADTPFQYKQVQSLPKENPAGAKPIREEDEKTKLPAAIAHAAGSSSDGWTPVAHFPSDGESTSQNSNRSKKPEPKKRTATLSLMESYDPDALQRPTGVIPLTVSNSDRDKMQLFRAEYSLEPVEDKAKTTDSSNKMLKRLSSSSKSAHLEHDDGQTASSTTKSSAKKLILYDGGTSQLKELWDFTMEGFDTKLDKKPQDNASSTQNKLVEYDKKGEPSIRTDVVEDSMRQSFKNAEPDQKMEH